MILIRVGLLGLLGLLTRSLAPHHHEVALAAKQTATSAAVAVFTGEELDEVLL